MSDNLSEGPIQVMDNDVLSINDALRQIVDRLDERKGLRGRSVVHDRVGVSTPTAGGDAVNLSTQSSAISVFSTITAGTTLTANPYAAGSVTTQAHGLGVEPFYCKVILECLTAEFGYSIGDRLDIGAGGGTGDHSSSRAFSIVVDATNVTLVLGGTNTAMSIPTKDGSLTSNAITEANWKVLIYPYKFS